MIAWLLVCALASLAGAHGAEASGVVTASVHPWAGQTYYLSAVQRPLRRARGTTLRALAAAGHARAGNSTAQKQQQQQQQKKNKPQLKDKEEALLRSRKQQQQQQQQQRAGPYQRLRRGQRPQAPLPRKQRPDPTEVVQPRGPPKGGPPQATVQQSFDGLNAFDQRFANNGNQAILDPPNQGLCVGNGYVLQTIDSVMRVYDAESGAPVTDVLAQSQFWGLPDQYNRASGKWGPYQADPSCWYDTANKRWFVVISTKDVDPDAFYFTGPNWLDIAVSDGDDLLTSSWTFFRVPGADDGSGGTPDVGCEGGSCLQDSPKLAVWEHALIITTNEFALDGSAFMGANVYAISKPELLRGAAEATTALVRTGGFPPANGDVLVESLVPATQVGRSRLGLENSYLMATPTERLSGDWVDHLQLLCLTGTASLDGFRPNVRLAWMNQRLRTNIQFAAPAPATQRPGVNPLGIVEYANAPVSRIDAGDGRLESLTFVDDCMLYAAWGSAVQVGSGEYPGVAWVVVDMSSPPRRVKQDGLLGLPHGNALLTPYLAVRPGGTGILSFSVAGPDAWPSAGFGVLAGKGLSQLQYVGEGQGVLDSFSGYDSPDGVNRFGWHGAAVVLDHAHGSFWFASEWVAQTCSVDDFVNSDGLCGDTRSYWCNTASRISQVTLDQPWVGR